MKRYICIVMPVVVIALMLVVLLLRGPVTSSQAQAAHIHELEARLNALESAQGVPSVVAYQGYLVDNGGAPITGAQTLVFRIYNQNDEQVWTETHNNVPVSDGYFSVMLGSKTDPLTPVVFNEAERWIEVSVNSVAMPRQQIGAVPYALSVPWNGISGRPDVGFTTIDATDSVDLTTAWQDAPGMTVTITPTVHERMHILVFGSFNQSLPETQKTEPDDVLRFGLSINGEDPAGGALKGGFASGNAGTVSRTLAYTLDLEAGNSYTISVQAINLYGNRGRFTREAQMVYWRVPRYP